MERDIEQRLIDQLQDLKYTYREDIHDIDSLEKNFRKKFDELNGVTLTDNEFNRLLERIVSNNVFTNSKKLREKHQFYRDDETPLYYTLLNIEHWCKNDFEVVNQLKINTKNSNHRYDTILLINGLPLVQIELKDHGITPRLAIKQIVDYTTDKGNGYTNTIMCFMQMFIVSNGSQTYYFSNNNTNHFNFHADEKFLPIYQFADRENNKINDLREFTKAFLSKCTLAETISHYMVLVATEKKILMMRPYQVYAVKAIIDCINGNQNNGYIWHTTGSGKTLTSFKASTLLKDNDSIAKCIFVVDRKDLDRQTREEFNRFQDKCVEENTNTEELIKKLLSKSKSDKVIVTTIQKLGVALNGRKNKQGESYNYKEELTPLAKEKVIFIFDECHRSQFGDNHEAIKNFFPNSQLFGFTGTPIFEKNASKRQTSDDESKLTTTEDVFDKELHRYTITHAIEDKNVLKFDVHHYKHEDENTKIKKSHKVKTIVKQHDSATMNRKFNAIFATASIDDAIEYYQLFKEHNELEDTKKPLNIACVFSPPVSVIEDKQARKDIKQIQEDLPQEQADNKENEQAKGKALKGIIDDYNTLYKTNFDLNKFDNYYQDVQKRIKDQQYDNVSSDQKPDTTIKKIDITIVVDMLLTGFDSKYLNTLYVDKNLKTHGLIQAFSRTNRVLNDTKPHGHIIDFRDQEILVDRAMALFSGTDQDDYRKIWLVEKAPVVIKQYAEIAGDLTKFMEDENLPCTPDQVSNLKGDTARIKFIEKFKKVQKITTKLDQYTDLTEEQRQEIENILAKEQLQGFRSAYTEVVKQIRVKQDKIKKGEYSSDDSDIDTLNNTDPELVLFASNIIDYDYIMNLIAKFASNNPNKKDKMTKQELIKYIKSDSKFIDMQDDLIEFIDYLEKRVKSLSKNHGFTDQDIKDIHKEFKENKYNSQIKSIALAHGLDEKLLQEFIKDTIRLLDFDESDFNELIKHLDLNWKTRKKKKEDIMKTLKPLLASMAGEQEIAGLSFYE